MLNYFIFLINVCWFCFGGNELSWTWTASCFLIGITAVQVFSFLVHLLWLFSMHTLFGGEPVLWGDGSFWVHLWCFAFLSDFNITFVSAKKEKPRLAGFPRQKAVVFQTWLTSDCQQFDLKLQVVKMENSSVQLSSGCWPLNGICLLLCTLGSLLFCLISTIHSL